ncbi:hypothetical protein B0H67DRAFT_215646 [Lasiosphaeris hirsuta]|uniref:Secreted protein n=1 Tax=Lasiosphaeris hirsuta TaxID=260670 RepID=A0AA40DV36_9PEZI|nr:hypothetical protein B0H67DRAFT_215646 [Lasiosphaeris hirsuta]
METGIMSFINIFVSLLFLALFARCLGSCHHDMSLSTSSRPARQSLNASFKSCFSPICNWHEHDRRTSFPTIQNSQPFRIPNHVCFGFAQKQTPVLCLPNASPIDERKKKSNSKASPLPPFVGASVRASFLNSTNLRAEWTASPCGGTGTRI